jgi:hypothetical protein
MPDKRQRMLWVISFSLCLSLCLNWGCGEFVDLDTGSISNLSQPLVGICSSSSPMMPNNCGSDMQSPEYSEAINHCKSAYSPIYRSTIPNDLLSACANMFMAKYYKELPFAFTQKGTRIEWADKNTPVGNSAREYGRYNSKSQLRLFEAIWGKDGAICITRPRWLPIHWRFSQGTSMPDLPDCRNRPIVASQPWIESPFIGNGLLISYSVNWDYIYILSSECKVSSGYCSAGEVSNEEGAGQEVIGQFLIYNRVKPPLGIPSKDGLDYVYENDDEYTPVYSWRACYALGANSVCDSILTASDMSISAELMARGIPPARIYSRGTKIGYILKSKKDGSISLNTYIDKNTGRHLTIGENSVSSAARTRNLQLVKTEGYVYTDEASCVCTSTRCPC